MTGLNSMFRKGTKLPCKHNLASLFLGELTMALGHGRLNSVGDIEKYNQLLKPKYNLI